MVTLRLPEDDWEVLRNALELDARSTASDVVTRSAVKYALANIEELCEGCADDGGRGWHIMDYDCTGLITIERCDTCEKYDSDEEAAAASGLPFKVVRPQDYGMPGDWRSPICLLKPVPDTPTRETPSFVSVVATGVTLEDALATLQRRPQP